MRLASLVVVGACGGGDAPKPIAPTAPPVALVDAAPAPVVTIDAAPVTDDPFDPIDPIHPNGPGTREHAWRGPIPPKPAAVPREPGIHPVLVRNGAVEDEAVYFVLGCAKVEKGKPTKFLNGKTCAPLLQNAPLELVNEKSRIPVKVIGRGSTLDCPWGDRPANHPFVKIAGLPRNQDEVVYGEIVGKGAAHYAGPVDADVLNAIRQVSPLRPTKRPNGYGPYPTAQYDLDGDGKLEVIMSMDGMELQLFTSDGTLVDTVGCYVG